MMLFRRGFQTSVKTCARTRYTKPKPKPQPRERVNLPSQRTHHDNDLRITAPVPPTVENIKCPDDHPLWQFFADRKFMRTAEELDSSSRPWSIPELRRKSFEDLHSLWYTCLKERNILARENHLLKNSVEGHQGQYEELSEKIRTTMWRIRHVLSERDWAFRIAREEFATEKEAFMAEFEREFLEAPEEEDEEAFEKLQRFQKAVFGISEFIDENRVDRAFVDGLKFVANLKLKKFAARDDSVKSFLEETPSQAIVDAGEAFVLFTAENNLNEMKEACSAVRGLREEGNSVSRYVELDTVSKYVKQLAQAQAAKESTRS
ncbi:hypothetical protein HG536_0C05810 [Torulaspora globosa]|uniref:Large ribosomal subunit protein uL29m n=1 Tax=Torulaspora globosa TaxID=48254 RepID=A0A7G3ZFX6_9SACH|nr:uncharacterized protein HG536_0C05810 [Torulaspora globosa]QLL32412.1 hypothetical protein HG536_0C05810 [Torulaspora globosa]